MTIKGQPVSKTSTGAWCSPNYEYGSAAHIGVLLDKFEVVETIGDSLPPCDEKWPKGAVIEGFYKVGNQIVKRT